MYIIRGWGNYANKDDQLSWNAENRSVYRRGSGAVEVNHGSPSRDLAMGSTLPNEAQQDAMTHSHSTTLKMPSPTYTQTLLSRYVRGDAYPLTERTE